MTLALDTATRPLRSELASLLAEEKTNCTGCGACVRECAFLKLYGAPRLIAASYDPEDPKKRVICFECSLCGLCSAVCPERLDPRALFLEMRREAVDRGHGSFAEHKGLIGYERTGMSPRFSWYGLPEGSTTIFFPGCALPGTRPAATREVYQRLQESVPALGLVLDCCTKPSHDLGRERFFRESFGEMTAWLESSGVRKVLVACPNCYKVFSEYAPQFETETVYQSLAGSMESAALSGAGAVTVHDPCVIRFAAAPQEAVRQLVQGSGRSIEEMPHSRKKALCCGEGGTVGALAPDLADNWGERRTKEAAGRQVVTYCAGCANRLGKRVRVSHVLDLIFDTPKPASGPLTYVNRLRLKSHFKKIVPAAVTRERKPAERSSAGVLRPLVILAALVALIVAVRASGAGQYLEPERLRALFASFGVVAPLVYIAFYTLAPALMLPGLPISMAGATVFGPVWGVVYTIIGATLGACVAFLVARYGARDWVERQLVGSRWQKLNSETAQNGWKAVAFTRLIPLFPFNLLNFAFGLTKISFVQYAVATFVFMLPGTIAFITFSSSLLGLLKGKVSREFFIGIVLIVGVSMLPKLARWYQGRALREPAPEVPWSLGSSLRRKGALIAGLLAASAGVYALALKFFWAIDAYLYTIEFNLLFVAHRLRDADLAGFIEYLRPMSGARAAAIALVCQAMQTFAFPLSPLKAAAAFASAFGPASGALYLGLAGLVMTCLVVMCGRLMLSDLRPLYNQSRGVAPLSPSPSWTGWLAAGMAAIPGMPLLLCGLWCGGYRIPLLRSIVALAAGFALRILVSIVAN